MVRRPLRRVTDVVADVEVEIAVSVGVEEGGRGRRSRVRAAPRAGGFLEGPVASVAHEAVGPEEVGEVEVGVSVAVEVDRGGAVPEALQQQAGPLGDLFEAQISEVAIESGPGTHRFASRQGVAVGDEEVQPSVPVVVERRRPLSDRLRDHGHPRRVAADVDQVDSGVGAEVGEAGRHLRRAGREPERQQHPQAGDQLSIISQPVAPWAMPR